MIFYLVLIVAVSIAVAVFAVSNASLVSVNLIFWRLSDASLALVILLSAAAGAVAASIVAAYIKIKDMARLRSLESQIKELQRQIDQRGLPLQ
jgi:uncharacterized integral membrane protein